MPDNSSKNPETVKHNETPKKRSFFGGEIDIKAKDLLDFRYNTQEEIDKLNEEMETNNQLNNIIPDNINGTKEGKDNTEIEEIGAIEGEIVDDLDDKGKEIEINNSESEIEDKHDTETNLDENIKELDENDNIQIDSFDKIFDKNSGTDNKKENIKIEDKAKDASNLEQENNEENTKFEDNEQLENQEDSEKDEKSNEEITAKFFDPFELNLEEDNDEENNERLNNDDMFDPFGLNEEESEDDNEENKNNDNEENEEDNEDNDDNEENEDDDEDNEDDDEDNEDDNEDNDDNEENEDDEDDDEDNEDDNEDNEDDEDDDEDNEDDNEDNDDNEENEIHQPIYIPKEKIETEKETTNHIKSKEKNKHTSTGEIITNEEIELEQGQDTPDIENDEEFQLTDEEIFEQEPEFFANDELSQQFIKFVQNCRNIFKLIRKDEDQTQYFKILGGKTENSTLEYLFYLIEEPDEPIDLFIKKIETNIESGDENEHLVQFSYNEEKKLNIFVDEVILYEKINKSDPSNSEYRDTKSILEKFIFLTETHYDELKKEFDKKYEEGRKKRQLQQIFKGF